MVRTILKISSPKLEEGGRFPEKYTFYGNNINIPLDIENIPKGAKSLAVIMETCDQDDLVRTHWVAWNIPLTHRIQERELRGSTGLNDFGGVGYRGPDFNSSHLQCVFRVYALDRFINFSQSTVSKFDLHGWVRYYGLGHGKFICNYMLSEGLKMPQAV